MIWICVCVLLLAFAAIGTAAKERRAKEYWKRKCEKKDAFYQKQENVSQLTIEKLHSANLAIVRDLQTARDELAATKRALEVKQRFLDGIYRAQRRDSK